MAAIRFDRHIAQEDARLEGCADPDTLERWLDQALTVASASEALR
ncbi:hypothetical protein [Archangium sp.]|nr:hypothetical protein [Archangium sp.]